MTTESKKSGEKKKEKLSVKQRVLKGLKISGIVFLSILLIGLTINSMLAIFVKHYYPTFGEYRLFAIVSDSMEPEIPTGDMIVGRVPKSEDDISVGTVITYELEQGNSLILITHRVTAVHINPETGVVSYTTKGDNLNNPDAVRPTYDSVVGIYSGKKCGFFGYFFGFLQAPEGTITLILILLIIVLTVIIVHFVNLVNLWRDAALSALRKSGNILNQTKIEELGTIADVIGIISKDPEGKGDIQRKDEKLKWFIQMNALPQRPYPDDLEAYLREHGDSLQPVQVPRLKYIDDEEQQQANVPSVAPSARDEELATTLEAPEEEIAADNPEYDDTDDEIEEIVEEGIVEESVAGEGVSDDKKGTLFRERVERIYYRYSFLARMTQLKDESKEWYGIIKNELLSYKRVKCRLGNRYETFNLGRQTVARLTVRGKTLCVLLFLDPDSYDDTKYTVERVNSSTPCRMRIRSSRRAKYACDLIKDMMKQLGGIKLAGYEQQVFELPEEDLVSLLQKGMVKRTIKSSEKYFRLIDGQRVEVNPDDTLCKPEENAVEAPKKNTPSTNKKKTDG